MSLISSKALGFLEGSLTKFCAYIKNIISSPTHGNISFIGFSLIFLNFIFDAIKYTLTY